MFEDKLHCKKLHAKGLRRIARVKEKLYIAKKAILSQMRLLALNILQFCALKYFSNTDKYFTQSFENLAKSSSIFRIPRLSKMALNCHFQRKAIKSFVNSWLN